MLGRYRIYRGKRPTGVQLPEGIRQDTRKHTQHCLRPPSESVLAYLADPTAQAWETFAETYTRTVQERFRADRSAFDELAELASKQDVYLGCSCPTAKNPDVQRCHTVLALQFMKDRYPALKIEFPKSSATE